MQVILIPIYPEEQPTIKKIVGVSYHFTIYSNGVECGSQTAIYIKKPTKKKLSEDLKEALEMFKHLEKVTGEFLKL